MIVQAAKAGPTHDMPALITAVAKGGNICRRPGRTRISTTCSFGPPRAEWKSGRQTWMPRERQHQPLLTLWRLKWAFVIWRRKFQRKQLCNGSVGRVHDLARRQWWWFRLCVRNSGRRLRGRHKQWRDHRTREGCQQDVRSGGRWGLQGHLLSENRRANGSGQC
jgi:hypothetical protein